MTTLSNISVEQLKRAVAVREQIEELERELAQILGETGSSASNGNGHGGRRTMSASARAKIAAAQRARWARQKASGKTRTMSPAARAKIAAAARARWAKAKAANRRTLAAA